MNARAFGSQSFQAPGVPEPPKPAAPMPRTTVVEQWDPIGKYWRQRLLVWNESTGMYEDAPHV